MFGLANGQHMSSLFLLSLFRRLHKMENERGDVFFWVGRGRLGFYFFFFLKKSWGCWLVAVAGAEHKTQLHAGWLAWVYVCAQDSCTPSTVYTHTCTYIVSSRTMVA